MEFVLCVSHLAIWMFMLVVHVSTKLCARLYWWLMLNMAAFPHKIQKDKPRLLIIARQQSTKTPWCLRKWPEAGANNRPINPCAGLWLTIFITVLPQQLLLKLSSGSELIFILLPSSWTAASPSIIINFSTYYLKHPCTKRLASYLASLHELKNFLASLQTGPSYFSYS